MSRSNKTDSEFLTGLLRKAITKRLSGVGRTFYLLSADYIPKLPCLANNRYEDGIVYTDISSISKGGRGMVNFQPFSGTVTMIDNFSIGQNNEAGCYKLIALDNGNGALVNFVVEPTTYFVDHVRVAVGDRITGFYDANAPVPFIFPPQFRALVMAEDTPNQNVKVAFFNSRLESSDGTLKLTISPHTQILLENGQTFTGNITNRNLIVSYGATTRSIPAQTTPHKIIVIC